MGLFSSVAGVFGATQEKRAAAEAARIIQEARAQGVARSTALDAEFTPFVTSAKETLQSSTGYLTRALAQAEGLDPGEGLSGADRIAYEDAAKLLNEQMVSTGNLRSGAAAFGQANLLRRVVADANARRFNRQVAKLQFLFGGAGQLASVGGTQGQIGLYGKQLSSQLLHASMNLAAPQAEAEIRKGKALSTGLGFAGSAFDLGMEKIGQSLASYGTTTTTPIDVASKYGTEFTPN